MYVRAYWNEDSVDFSFFFHPPVLSLVAYQGIRCQNYICVVVVVFFVLFLSRFTTLSKHSVTLHPSEQTPCFTQETLDREIGFRFNTKHMKTTGTTVRAYYHISSLLWKEQSPTQKRKNIM